MKKGKGTKSFFQSKSESSVVRLAVKLKYFWWFFIESFKGGCHPRCYLILFFSIFEHKKSFGI
jgi:hypothetical protein